MAEAIRIGARGSKLALWQAERVKELLENTHPGSAFKITVVSTSGDRDHNTPLTQMGGVGVFVKELENALLEEQIDIAVHSAKDLPSTLPEGFEICAVPERAAVEDALLCNGRYDLDTLPENSIIATGSPRRRAFLKRYRPDFQFCEVRGNIDTRLWKLQEGQFDAIVLARAGLERLGYDRMINQTIPTNIVFPAPGQGSIAVEMLTSFEAVREITDAIDNPVQHACLQAERSMMRTLQAGCSSAVGGYCRYDDMQQRLVMHAAVTQANGWEIIEVTRQSEVSDLAYIWTAGETLGKYIAQDLLEKGAGACL